MYLGERVIHGHCDLHLIPGRRYRISYGENQGIYVYEGQYEKGDSEWNEGASKFVNETNGHLFCYHGTTTPYEFTSIVRLID